MSLHRRRTAEVVYLDRPFDDQRHRLAAAERLAASAAEDEADFAAAEWARTARLGAAGAVVGTALAFASDHSGVAELVADLFRWWFT